MSGELARRCYGSAAGAIGRLIRVGDADPDRLTIVGVAADVKVRSLSEPPRFSLYQPLGQVRVREVSALIRGDAGGLARDVGATLRAIDPDLPLMGNLSFERHVGIALLPRRMAVLVSATLGVVGLLLAAIGVYGIVAYAASQRTREIGIRVAIGATPGGVARFMAAEGVRLIAIGLGIGLVLAVGGGQLLRTFMLGMNPYDPMAFGAAVGGLFATAIRVRAAVLHPKFDR